MHFDVCLAFPGELMSLKSQGYVDTFMMMWSSPRLTQAGGHVITEM